MGGTGVAVDDPSTAPFFNPAMLSASDPKKKFSFEFVTLGVSVVDPGNLHSNATTMQDAGTSLSDTGTTLNTNASALTTNTSTLTTSISTLTTSITSLASANANNAASLLTQVSTNLSSISTNLTSVSKNTTDLGNNANTVSSNISTINQALLNLNNQPLQASFGAATVIAIPSKEWGLALYANAWGAMGGTLEYKDAGTVTTITTLLTTTGNALTSAGTATSTAASAISTANTSVSAAATLCTATLVLTGPGALACNNALITANSALATAGTSLSSASTTMSSNATSISNAASSLKSNTTIQSTIHIRGVGITESGLSISHAQVTNDVEWSWGVTPKVMQLRMFDATIAATGGVSSSALNDNLAYYSTLNFDAGLAKVFLNGWRTGIVVKNVIPQTFDFKSAPTAGATPVANGATLNLNPQVRAGLSYENSLFMIALDGDLTRNDPAGLEDPSQIVALGVELNLSGWTQFRAGYSADMVNAARNVASIGWGFSPRVPYFKPHFDIALTASPDLFNNGLNGVTQMGMSMKFGMNF
jgi:hypothetical protein